MKLKSNFALLDVERGRVGLKKKIDNGAKIPVIIHGTIDAVWGHDDGISREFSVIVDKVEVQDDKV